MSAKTPARLSSGLLSSKGMAAPSAGREDRANKVGSLGTPDSTTPAESTRPQQRQGPAPARSTLADWVAPDSAGPPAGAPSQDTPAKGSQIKLKRVRVSLRLDEDRHTRLKLVATQRNCTLQALFNDAIDEFFIRHAPDLHGISAQLRGRTKAQGATQGTGKKTTRSKQDTEGRNGPSRSK